VLKGDDTISDSNDCRKYCEEIQAIIGGVGKFILVVYTVYNNIFSTVREHP